MRATSVRVCAVIASMLLAGCGGGGSGGGTAAAGGGASSPPTINFSANPTSVSSGSSSMLTWSAANADSCTASGGWSGNKAVSGSASTGAISTATQYTLNCNGPGGGAIANVTVNISSSTTASATLSASPPGVAPGGTTTLDWTSSNVTSCAASNGWSGSKALSGSEATGAINSDQTYTLTCTGTSGNAVASTTVTVRTAVVSWTAPTQNTDGSALTNLAAYKVYWGPSSRNYTQSATVNAPTTTYTTALTPGTWYFAISAIDLTNAESAKTNEVSKTVF